LINKNINLNINTTGFVQERISELREKPLPQGTKKPEISFEKVPDKDNFASNKTKLALKILSPVPQLRKLSSIPENIQQGNWARAIGLLGFMIVYLPEDTRDLMDGWKQISGKSKIDFNYYKNYQVPFAFLKGTMLEPLLSLKSKTGQKISRFLKDADNTLYDTKIKDFLQKIFKFEKTGEKSTGRIYAENIEVFAIKIKGNYLAKTVAKSLMRITFLGMATLSLLELPAIIKSIRKPEDKKEKPVTIAKQLLKSTAYVGTMASSIGFAGAALQPFGPAGSLLGMGIGAIIGGTIIKSINKFIDKTKI
jgi:hypothetical protein